MSPELPFPLFEELQKLRAYKPEALLYDERDRLKDLEAAFLLWNVKGREFNEAMDRGDLARAEAAIQQVQAAIERLLK